ncbi:hypothetical protein DXI23_18755 [Marinobacter flavimaris]|uniref:DUF4852 domain-containing protein n=1 Tax=Marinobacter flavimaris TaxID=262076 RepID=A0A3D8GY41_9GAMM|nr:hypothetical protein [Marinobacter flavimaris]PPI78741.1 hypothetical protein MDHKLMBL_18840 [Marinobacter flavimaris]RDU39302.1 hypothetical protein DXI23_18755 [Marinobacter flavimaris]
MGKFKFRFTAILILFLSGCMATTGGSKSQGGSKHYAVPTEIDVLAHMVKYHGPSSTAPLSTIFANHLHPLSGEEFERNPLLVAKKRSAAMKVFIEEAKQRIEDLDIPSRYRMEYGMLDFYPPEFMDAGSGAYYMVWQPKGEFVLDQTSTNLPIKFRIMFDRSGPSEGLQKYVSGQFKKQVEKAYATSDESLLRKLAGEDQKKKYMTFAIGGCLNKIVGETVRCIASDTETN